MPTVITHAIVAAGLYRGATGPHEGSRTGMWTAAALAMLPDLDVVTWRVVEHDSMLWHRGLTHSVVFGVAAGVLAAWMLHRRVRPPGGAAALGAVVAACVCSHGFLDAFTDGGSGVGFLLPFEATRTRFAAQPIPVAPISVNPGNARIWTTLQVEVLLLWPAAVALGTLRTPLHWAWRLVILAGVAGSAWLWAVRM